MPVEVILPKVDMDMATGRISRWYVEDGAVVKKGDLLFEIETDKAAMEIDAPATGTIRDIIGKEGVDIPVGETVAWIYAEGEDIGTPPAARAEPARVTPAPKAEQVSQTPAASTRPVATEPVTAKPAPAGAVRATPLARRIAADAGLKLETVAGSGPNGRIMRKDVDAAITAGAAAVSASPRISPAPAFAGAPLSHVPASAGASLNPVPASAGAPLNHVWLRQGEGRPLVLIHGFGTDLNSWRAMLGAGAVDAPVLGIDLPGHGGSPRAVPADMDAIAADVEATLSAHGLGPVTLAGHSFGGAVAATVAARGQTDVRALALIAPAGLGPEINGAFLSGFTRARSEASLLPWLKLLVANPALLTRAFVNATLAQSADEELRSVQSRIADRFFADGTQTIDIRPLVAGLHVPTRVIVGARDRIIPARQAQGLPGPVALHVFQETGHVPQLEQAEAVLRILLEMSRA